jgi:tripartite-type tricarboxylate transporter receptor subunit TctC
MKVFYKSILPALSLSLVACSAGAATFPDREIKVIVNYGAGGVTDVAARVVTRALEKNLGKPVTVINRPGGQATLGPSFVARQPPDGYTVGVVTFAAVAIVPHLIDVDYTIKDFDFIGGFGQYRYGLAVRADAPYKTVAEFVNAAKAASKPMFFSAPGAPNNLAMWDLGKKSGAKFEQVLYKSGIDSVMAVVSGDVQAVIQTPSEILPQVKGGKIRLLASVSPERWSDMPEIPTMREAGFDVQINSWMGLAVPKNTPKEVVARLQDALMTSMKDPQVIQALKSMGIDPLTMSGAEYTKKVSDGYVEMGKALKENGLAKPN